MRRRTGARSAEVGVGKGCHRYNSGAQDRYRHIVGWPSFFEKHRRVVLGASMMAIQGRIQREREVVHLRWQLNDPTGDLAALADRDTEFWDRNERGDEFAHGSPDGGDGRDRCRIYKSTPCNRRRRTSRRRLPSRPVWEWARRTVVTNVREPSHPSLVSASDWRTSFSMAGRR